LFVKVSRVYVFATKFPDNDGAIFGANTWLDLWSINLDQLKLLIKRLIR